METKGFFQFQIIINVLALSSLFKFVSQGSTNIINIVFFQCGDGLYTYKDSEVFYMSDSDIYRRQILTYKECPHAERVKLTG